MEKITKTLRISLFATLAGIVLAACRAVPGVDAARLAGAVTEAGSWLMDGRDYDAQRYSPLSQINESTVKDLGLAWYADLETLRGVEATPLYADGVLYNTSAWNITSAYDARNGRRLWTFDPKVPRERGRYACCEPVARGLALWKKNVIVSTLDGRLIALDARNGRQRWSVRTFGDDWPYTITGTPRVFDGVVVVGNSGADLGVRGFVSGYDADTGRQLWKFFLVPGDPSKGPDGAASDAVLPMMAATWSGEWWKLGGGATAWDSFTYDRKRGVVYIGTGNGSPHTPQFRSPGGGDNLFVCSIVAVDVRTGEYRWHYQEVPKEGWDYTCTQSIVLATLPVDGQPRDVLMHAPKNGFFYVMDRDTGKLISAKNYAPVNWASHIDLVTGRPVTNPAAAFGEDPVLVTPGPGGAHNWFPMAFSPQTGLAYFPAYEHWYVYAAAPTFEPKPFRSNSGYGAFGGELLKKRLELQKEGDKRERAWLVAWDPLKQAPAWEVPLPRHGNGGVLATAGNLVIEGTTRQTLSIFRATDGMLLWEKHVQSAPVAGPITYDLDGVQYIAVNAGWGGGAAQIERGLGTAQNRAAARLLVFRLGGKVELPPLPDAAPVPNPPPVTGSEAQIRRGGEVYALTCAQCHGDLAIGGVKDLRQMTPGTHAQFNDIVLKGLRQDKGMASFAGLVAPDDVDAIHAWLIARANEDWGR
jgi:quinohemoprotein ethanol dehydrogenase